MPPSRRWLRFGLRTIFLVAAFCVGMAVAEHSLGGIHSAGRTQRAQSEIVLCAPSYFLMIVPIMLLHTSQFGVPFMLMNGALYAFYASLVLLPKGRWFWLGIALVFHVVCAVLTNVLQSIRI